MFKIYAFLLFLFLTSGLLAQEVFLDTLYEGHTFHVRYYDDSARVICIGNYLPHTCIRTGEWDYFYPDGNLYARSFFRSNLKAGVWLYYAEDGTVVRGVKHAEKAEPFFLNYQTAPDVDKMFEPYYLKAQQNPYAVVQFTHGNEPLEYDEKIYALKIKVIQYYASEMRKETDDEEMQRLTPEQLQEYMAKKDAPKKHFKKPFRFLNKH